MCELPNLSTPLEHARDFNYLKRIYAALSEGFFATQETFGPFDGRTS